MSTTPITPLHDPASPALDRNDTPLAHPGCSTDSGTALPHPEEMKLSMECSMGKGASMKCAIRATPAGLAATALLVSAILVPLVWLMRDRRRPRV